MKKSISNPIKFSTFENKILNYVETNLVKICYVLSILVGGLFRLYFASNATGILHPDEVFQSLEVAHFMVYGSGIIPPEFQLENEFISSYAQSRSWLFPLIFASIMRIGEALSMNYHTQILVLIRYFLAFNAILLIPATKKFTYSFTGNETVGYLSAIFVALWFKIIEFTVRPFSNTFFLPLLLFGIAKAIDITKEPQEISFRQHIIFIITLGFSTYIRLDMGILVFSIFLVTFNSNNMRNYIAILIDGSIAWLIGAFYDLQYYGTFLSVPKNWFTFNVIENNSDIFGTSKFGYYFINTIYLDFLSFWIFLVVLKGIILSKNYVLRKKISPAELNFLKLFIGTLLIWTIYENPLRETHKEQRFFIGTLILILVLITFSLKFLVEDIENWFILKSLRSVPGLPKEVEIDRIRLKYNFIKPVATLLIVLLLFSQNSNGFNSRMHNESFDDVNRGLVYIGQQPDLKNVIVLSVWYLTGAYTYLHANASTTIRFHTFGSGNDTGIKLYFLQLDLMNNTFNYLLIPYYELRRYGNIIDIIINLGWELRKVFSGTSEVWHHKREV